MQKKNRKLKIKISTYEVR